MRPSRWRQEPLQSASLASGARGQLLHGPTVGVRVAEIDELPPVELLDVADLDPALDKLGAGCVYVGDDQLQPLDRAGLHLRQPGPDRDRARRSGRGQLNK